MTVYLNQLGLVCALGNDPASVRRAMSAGDRGGLVITDHWHPGHPGPLGQVRGELPGIPAALADYACRNNQLLLAALAPLRDELARLARGVPRERIGVVLGTSTSGIDQGERAMACWRREQPAPADYHYRQQLLGSGADFLARHLDVRGPALTLSTACSSSGRALASARALLRNGLCDLVIAGGADSLCHLTVQGFRSLGAVSDRLCNPFSVNRDGINIGEGAALFLMSREPGPVALTGVGASSDAHHISAPDPHGAGASAAMNAALADADRDAGEIDYLNLHGTATPQNDAMEARAVRRVFPEGVPASATKALTGHCLGAAAALEAGLCWLVLSDPTCPLPPHCNDGQLDPALPALNLVAAGGGAANARRCLSNAFAFGGNNLSLLLETTP
ncbi:beta-ketoacyl-ACP synthase [Alloalcanivorax mobilis]|uniref:beta-ketoacyl-ACP synthase n=1 Tax=Alloalcanivorax mobilis TaxID=2019569 RepID=UPI000C7815C8|nr:beta-ketoacyl-ACP synthase [Alloalcanivorax mobilis]